MAHNSRIFILKLVCFLSRYSFCFFPLVVLVLVLLVVVLLALNRQFPVRNGTRLGLLSMGGFVHASSFFNSEHYLVHFTLNSSSLLSQNGVVQSPSFQLFLLMAMILDEMLD